MPDDPAQLAVLAVKVAGVFLPGGPAAEARGDAAVAAAIVRVAADDAGRGEPTS